MRHLKTHFLSILVALLLTLPICTYVLISAYLWITSGQTLDPVKFGSTLILGSFLLLINVWVFAQEGPSK